MMKEWFLGSEILEDLEEVRGEEKWVSAILERGDCGIFGEWLFVVWVHLFC